MTSSTGQSRVALPTDSSFSLTAAGGALAALSWLSYAVPTMGHISFVGEPGRWDQPLSAGDTYTAAAVEHMVSNADLIRALSELHSHLLSESQSLPTEDQELINENLWDLYQ